MFQNLPQQPASQFLQFPINDRQTTVNQSQQSQTAISNHAQKNSQMTQLFYQKTEVEPVKTNQNVPTPSIQQPVHKPQAVHQVLQPQIPYPINQKPQPTNQVVANQVSRQ